MSEPQERSRAARSWWLAPLGLCLCLGPCLTRMTCGLEPRAIVAGIPLGSKLSDLDRHLGTFYESSNVDQWVPDRTPATSEKPVATSFGPFYVRHLGSYPSWSPTKSEVETFTGELRLSHFSDVIPDDLAPSFSIRLIYVGGVLKDKDSGILPG